MDLSIIRRRSRVDLDGDHLVVIHRPATVAHLEAWRAHEAAAPAQMTDVTAVAWLRDGRVIASSILRDLVLGWADVTDGGQPVTTERATEVVLGDWPMLRRVVAQIMVSASLDEAVGKD